ncbi:sensor histidine kinase [Pedobacter frigidisoli]|uniref:ATP-binding protein n=1 Tax=Pedobacter frigidisoli TaxID=2530455 RepID=UPI00292CEBEC|nr:sensor histidine kinase [Pedobacter frigidisoli]
MKEILDISLENEMDLVLAHRRSMQVGEQLGLTVATRTTFATAVSEISRTAIEYTDNGRLNILISGKYPRYSLYARVVFDSDQTFRATDEGFFYAKKLLPDFSFSSSGNAYVIEMGLGLPRSLKLDETKLSALKLFFENVIPLNAYEEIKQKNFQLHRLTGEQEEEIRMRRDLDEKKSEFISVASHELKTPITVVKAYTQMLKLLKDQYTDKVAGVIDKLDVQTTKLSLLAQQLMDVSKVENGSLLYDLVDVDLNEFVNETVTMLSNVHSSNQINISLGTPCRIMADPLRLEQVLTNLLGNAVKYSARNAAIDIETVLSETGDSVIIKVTDCGIGMSSAGIAKIFDKFYRMDDVTTSHPGLGMGLYISSKIISEHGGKIWVESTLNQGSTFFFTIPVQTV